MSAPTERLEQLAARVEAEEIHPVVNFLWIDAAKAALPKHFMPGPDNDKFMEFRRLAEAGAYLDAADMLRPEGWMLDQIFEIGSGETTVVMYRDHLTDKQGGVATGKHAMARAMLAAALRARAAGADHE